MSDQHRPQTAMDRVAIELQALGRCMTLHEDNSALRKTATIVLLLGWLGWSIGIDHGTLTPGNSILWGHSAYHLFSYMTIYAFARLHDLEVKALLPVANGLNDTDDEE